MVSAPWTGASDISGKKEDHASKGHHIYGQVQPEIATSTRQARHHKMHHAREAGKLSTGRSEVLGNN